VIRGKGGCGTHVHDVLRQHEAATWVGPAAIARRGVVRRDGLDASMLLGP